MFLNNKKIRMKTLLLLLMLFIPLFCVGCGRSKVYENSGLMNDEQLSTLESLYGKGKADVLEVLNLEESSVLQGGNRGCWDLKDTVSLVGTDFSQTLLYDVSSETLYGISYQYGSDDESTLLELVENLLDECGDLYGEPSTYSGVLNRLTSEDFAQSFSKAWSSGYGDKWWEEWLVGENTLYTLSVYVLVDETGKISSSVTLVYKMIVDT